MCIVNALSYMNFPQILAIDGCNGITEVAAGIAKFQQKEVKTYTSTGSAYAAPEGSQSEG